jgi:hypothetical protein
MARSPPPSPSVRSTGRRGGRSGGKLQQRHPTTPVGATADGDVDGVPRPAEWVRMQRLLRLLLQAVFCLGGLLLVLIDLHVGGVLGGTSNGKFVSFMDSVNSLSDYRSQQPFPPPRPGDTVECCVGREQQLRKTLTPRRRARQYSLMAEHTLGQRLYILLAACYSKYGSATVASLMLKQTPVVMKGPRHLLSFLVSSSRLSLLHPPAASHCTHNCVVRRNVVRVCASTRF